MKEFIKLTTAFAVGVGATLGAAYIYDNYIYKAPIEEDEDDFEDDDFGCDLPVDPPMEASEASKAPSEE